MNTAKEWWGDPNSAIDWLRKCEHWEKQDKGNSKNYKVEEDFLIEEILKEKGKIKTILEVGAGNGRIIGKISKYLFINRPEKDYLEQFNCSSIDINPELSKYVKEQYPRVNAFVGEIANLPFKDKEFDLVYTHEVLQHIDPSEIDKACSELKRVGREVWCMENWRSGQENGEKVSDSHSGRWNYNLKKYFNTYYDFYTDWGQLFVKAK